MVTRRLEDIDRSGLYEPFVVHRFYNGGRTVFNLNPGRCSFPFLKMGALHKLDYSFHRDIDGKNDDTDPGIPRCEIFHIDRSHKKVGLRSGFDFCYRYDVVRRLEFQCSWPSAPEIPDCIR